jgi:hypothetical protein
LPFFDPKKDIKIKISTDFFPIYGNPGFGFDLDPDSLDMLDPGPELINPDPQH